MPRVPDQLRTSSLVISIPRALRLVLGISPFFFFFDCFNPFVSLPFLEYFAYKFCGLLITGCRFWQNSREIWEFKLMVWGGWELFKISFEGFFFLSSVCKIVLWEKCLYIDENLRRWCLFWTRFLSFFMKITWKWRGKSSNNPPSPESNTWHWCQVDILSAREPVGF